MATVSQIFEGITITVDNNGGVEFGYIALPSGKKYYGVLGWDSSIINSHVAELTLSSAPPDDIESMRKLGQVVPFIWETLTSEAAAKSAKEDAPSMEPARFGRPNSTDSSPPHSEDAGSPASASAKPTKGSMEKPPERSSRPNPLGDYSTSTYQLGLYMMTPEAANRYYLTDETLISNINNESKSGDPIAKGFYLVAQSGGIDDSTGNSIGGISRIPSKDGRSLNDVFIDDLKMKTFVSTQSTESNKPITVSFSFKIYEPFGASFTETLVNAASILLSKSTVQGSDRIPSVLAQHYAIGLKFIGYNADGTIVKNDSITEGNLFRFFPVKITGIKFRLSGNVTVYDVTAESESHLTAFNVKRGTLPTTMSGSGVTVDDAFNHPTDGLVSALNKHELDMARDRKLKVSDASEIIIPNNYKVEFRPDAKEISNAKLMSDDELKYLKNIVPMSAVSETRDVTAKVSANNKKVDVNHRTITFGAGTSIVGALEQVIKHSTYIKDMIGTARENDIEIKIEKKEDKEPTTFGWFTVTPSIKILGFDTVLNDHSYEITYTIGKYIAPHIKSPYVRKLPKYPGPFKRYDYWYTGKNTEIISYDQSIDMLYYVLGVRANNSINPNIVNVAKKQGMPSNGNSQGADKNQLEPVNSLASSMYDITSQFNAKMTIIGDPDYIVHHVGDRQKILISPDGTTIDPISQQNFIEIKFRQGDDYSHNDGLMKLDKLTFYREGSLAAKLDKGMTFLLLSVDSNFVGGKFTQEVAMVPHILEDSAFEDEKREEKSEVTPTTATGRPTASREYWNMGPPKTVKPSAVQPSKVVNKEVTKPFVSVNDDNYVSKMGPPISYSEGRESTPVGTVNRISNINRTQ